MFPGIAANWLRTALFVLLNPQVPGQGGCTRTAQRERSRWRADAQTCELCERTVIGTAQCWGMSLLLSSIHDRVPGPGNVSRQDLTYEYRC